MLVYLLFFIVFVGNFVCSDGGAQPWPLHIEKIGSCCSSLQFSNKFGVTEDSETLNRCLSQEYFPRVNGIPSETNVSLLVLSSPGTGTFAIDKIDYYTPFQFSVIASYCEQRHYHCHLLSSLPSLEVNHILEDFRWYKVQLLIDAFTSWGKDQQAIVWIDSDAIILDFGLSIEEILRLYSDADIIASADIKLGLVNTGFMIFRNTEWTLSFLREWWSIADKSVTCDQEAFDQLYIQLLSSSSLEQKKTGKIPKIQILSTDQINSHPPAWLHHKNNPVLHLMGEISLYRAEVFRKAFYSICQARSGGVLPTLLNIRRDYLLEVARQVYRNETQQSFLLANQSGNLYDYERFSKASHHYVDVLQHDLEKQIKKLGSRGRILSSQSNEQQVSKLQEEILKIRKALFHLCLLRIENINQLLTQTNEKIKDLQTPRHQQTRDDVPSIESLEDVFTYQNQSNELLVDLLQFEKKGAEAGNSYFWSLPVTAIPEKENVSEQILRLLNDLIDRVDIQSQLVPYHMKALLHQNLGIMYYEEYQRLSTESAKELNVREELLRKAKRSTKFSLEIFDRYFQQSNDSSTQLEYLHTVQLLAAIYCIEKDYSHGLSFWQRAVDQAMQSTKGLQIGIHFEKLSIVLFNAAICFREGQKPLKALELLKQSKDTLNQLILEKRSKHSNEMVYNKQMDDIQYLFKMVTNYLNDTEVEFNQLSSSTNLNPKSKSPEPLHASPAISKSDTPVMKMIHNADGSVKYIPEDVLSQLKPGSEDDYEWEECTDLENDDCETFYVHEEQTSPPSDGVSDKEQQEKLHIEMSENKVVDDESYLYEGLSEEEARELSEIRKRYARATSKSVSDSINQLNNQNERATKDVENIVEGNTGKPSDLQSQVIQLLNEKIALMEEIQNLKQENRLLKQRMKQIVGIGALSD